MHIRYDNEKLTGILRDLSILTGISISFLDTAYEPVCDFKRTDDFCSAYQAQNGKDYCRHSDRTLLEKCRISGQLEYHLCHAGLYDAAMPVIKSGITVGYILMGRLHAPASPACPQLSGSLAELYGQVPSLNDVQLESLRRLLSNILFSNAIDIEYNELAEEISEYICTHLTDTLSVSALCEKFFVSRNSLYKCFRNYYGLTVNDYIIRVRLDHAKKLLTETNETVNRICADIGIQNEPYFCRLFKKHTGLSPTAYRCKGDRGAGDQVSTLCKDGKITGALKQGNRWLIPADTQKPADQRIKSGAYRKTERAARLPLPIGVSNYILASSEYYYIDKTMMLKDFIDERPMVTLFTRPRRFGKTLNMDMLRTFFEKSDKDTSVCFRNKKIWACGQKYRDYQGKYPVIFLTFKDVKFNTWEETFSAIRDIFAKETQRHGELRTSNKCDEYSKQIYEKLAVGKVSEVELASALLDLSKMLHQHYGIAPIIIIDEYDTPIQQGYMKDYYDKAIQFMRNLFSGGFKDNQHLSFGFLTGILRVAKESIFSGMNNLSINSVLDNKYSTYFGFTADEVREMAEYYGAADKYDEICQWYDGYRFGKTEIFNPWSVINYFSNECEPRPFWVSTGSNDIIGEVLAEADEEIYNRLTSLVNGETFTTFIDTGVIYPQIKSNPSTIYSFLLVTGYLKVLKTTPAFNGDFMCEVALPNREISLVYNKEILQRLENLIPQSTAISIQEAIFSGDNARLKAQIQTLLTQSVSSFDTAGENFYHGFMLGLCALLGGAFVTSNRESDDGRYDIQLKPTRKELPGILIELKAEKNCSNEKLKTLSETALRQINDQKYDTELIAAGVKTIYKYGVAFSGKKVEIMVG